MYSRAQQAGLYYARRNRLSRQIIQGLTPWSAGLSVTAGQYVQNAGNAYEALNTATTGSSSAGPQQPSGQFSDGGVTWQFVDPQKMVRFLYTGVPEPA